MLIKAHKSQPECADSSSPSGQMFTNRSSATTSKMRGNADQKQHAIPVEESQLLPKDVVDHEGVDDLLQLTSYLSIPDGSSTIETSVPSALDVNLVSGTMPASPYQNTLLTPPSNSEQYNSTGSRLPSAPPQGNSRGEGRYCWLLFFVIALFVLLAGGLAFVDWEKSEELFVWMKRDVKQSEQEVADLWQQNKALTEEKEAWQTRFTEMVENYGNRLALAQAQRLQDQKAMERARTSATEQKAATEECQVQLADVQKQESRDKQEMATFRKTIQSIREGQTTSSSEETSSLAAQCNADLTDAKNELHYAQARLAEQQALSTECGQELSTVQEAAQGERARSRQDASNLRSTIQKMAASHNASVAAYEKQLMQSHAQAQQDNKTIATLRANLQARIEEEERLAKACGAPRLAAPFDEANSTALQAEILSLQREGALRVFTNPSSKDEGVLIQPVGAAGCLTLEKMHSHGRVSLQDCPDASNSNGTLPNQKWYMTKSHAIQSRDASSNCLGDSLGAHRWWWFVHSCTKWTYNASSLLLRSNDHPERCLTIVPTNAANGSASIHMAACNSDSVDQKFSLVVP